MGNFLLTVLMDDTESAKIIVALNEPGEMKKIGRHVQNLTKNYGKAVVWRLWKKEI